MKPSLENVRVNHIVDMMPFLTGEAIARIIAAAECELRERDDMLFGKTNALEGIK